MRALLMAAACFLLACCSGKEGKPIDNTPSGSAAKPGSVIQGSGSAAGTEDPFDKAIVGLEGFRARMCECKDVTCTDKVFAEFTTWRMELRKTHNGKRPNKEQDQKGNQIDHELKACRAKVAVGVTSGSGSAAIAAGINPVDAALIEMDGFKTKMCACTDKTCADKVQADLATWQRALRAKMVEKPNTLQEVRGNALDKDIKDCRKKAETATPGATGGTSKIDNMLTSMQGYRDKVCACATKDCATKVETEMQTWLQQAAKDIADAKPTKDQDDKADRLQAEMKTCLGKLK